MRWERNRCLWHRTHVLIFVSFFFNRWADWNMIFHFIVDLSFLFFFVLSSKLKISRKENSEWSSLFCLLYVIRYIHVLSHFYRCWVEERSTLSISINVGIRIIYRGERERDRENTFSFVLLPFSLWFIILLAFFFLLKENWKGERKKRA
jgi:hypothetical protein